MAITIECVVVSKSKESIEFDLAGYGILVYSSRFLEEGWFLVLEAEASELNALILEWQEDGVLVSDEQAQ